MNHKLAFILPRAAAVTLIAGIAAFLLFLVFKIALFLLAAGAVLFAIKVTVAFFLQPRDDNYNGAATGIVPVQESDPISPVSGRKEPVIIPVR